MEVPIPTRISYLAHLVYIKQLICYYYFFFYIKHGVYRYILCYKLGRYRYHIFFNKQVTAITVLLKFK